MALDNNASVMKSPLAGPKRGAFEAEIGNPIATPTQDQHKTNTKDAKTQLVLWAPAYMSLYLHTCLLKSY